MLRMENFINNIWACSENYLSLGQAHYTVVSSGRSRRVVYKKNNKENQYSTVLKFFHVASFSFILLPILSLIVRKICRKTMPYLVCDIQSNPVPTSKCEAIATKHSLETHEWRKRLIQIANHNILISGNYCGGDSFNEILDCIYSRMRESNNLKVIVISNPKFLTSANKQKIEKLQKYNKRFQIVYSPDTYFGLKKVTNHTKCMVIDYGKYFIQGGSGIKDNFFGLGCFVKGKQKKTTHNLNFATFLKSNDDILQTKKQKTKNKTTQDDFFIDYNKANLNEDLQRKKREHWIEKMLPNQFRDQDFVFHSTDEGIVGKKNFQGNVVFSI